MFKGGKMNINIKRVKIFVTVPKENVESVRNAVCEAGAGKIGNYTFCTFASCGEGTFLPNDNANPFIGKNGKMEFVNELKLEFVCDTQKVKQVVTALRKVHPYEEPAIDIIPLIDEDGFN